MVFCFARFLKGRVPAQGWNIEAKGFRYGVPAEQWRERKTEGIVGRRLRGCLPRLWKHFGWCMRELLRKSGIAVVASELVNISGAFLACGAWRGPGPRWPTAPVKWFQSFTCRESGDNKFFFFIFF